MGDRPCWQLQPTPAGHQEDMNITKESFWTKSWIRVTLKSGGYWGGIIMNDKHSSPKERDFPQKNVKLPETNVREEKIREWNHVGLSSQGLKMSILSSTLVYFPQENLWFYFQMNPSQPTFAPTYNPQLTTVLLRSLGWPQKHGRNHNTLEN